MCDPFFGIENNGGKLQFFRCYDVTPPWMPSRGTWTFELSISKEGETSFLVLRTSKKRRGRPSTKRPRPTNEYRFPLYYDGGSNCVLIGSRDGALEDLGPNTPWDEDHGFDEDEETLDAYRLDRTRAESILGASSQNTAHNNSQGSG